MTRERYLHQLESLCADLLNMGTFVERAFRSAVHSLESRNATVIAAVIDGDRAINAMQQTIEEQAVQLIATQHPVAGDLRLLISAVAIANEIERIGDYACGIAKRSRNLAQQPVLITPPSMVYTIATLAQEMLRTSLTAFLDQNVDLAYSLQQAEAQVDALQRNLRAELLQSVRTDTQHVEVFIDLLDIQHIIERVADRTTNIGERVIYLATSATENLNPDTE